MYFAEARSRNEAKISTSVRKTETEQHQKQAFGYGSLHELVARTEGYKTHLVQAQAAAFDSPVDVNVAHVSERAAVIPDPVVSLHWQALSESM